MAIFFLLLLFAYNFNTVLYLITRDTNFLQNGEATATNPSVRFSIPSGTFNTGDIISVAVLLNSPTFAINADAGEVFFPADKLRLTDISTDNSINTLWIPGRPSLSTTSDSVIFSGGTPNPGFTGMDGNIMTLTFQVIGIGDAQLSVSNLLVLENDGLGTSLPVSSQSSHFTLQNNPAASGGGYQLGDLNHDGKVNLSDLSILIGSWKSSKNTEADLNHDGVVDVKDLSALLSKMETSR